MDSRFNIQLEQADTDNIKRRVNMEKFAYKIEHLLLEKLSLYEKLQTIFEEEKTYVIDMEIDSLWVTISKKKSLALSIESVRQKIIFLFDQTYSGLNMDTQPFSLSYMIKIMNVPSEKRMELRKINLAVTTCKKQIARLAYENKNYINEYLAIIDGVFSTVLDTTDKKQYSNSGTVLKNDDKNLLINTEV